VRGRGIDDVLVHPDLEPDHVQAPGQLADLGDYPILMLAEQGQSLLLVSVTAADELGVLPDRRDNDLT
jgi:hypothetical protein